MADGPGGGGVFNVGTMTLTNTTVSSNQATGYEGHFFTLSSDPITSGNHDQPDDLIGKGG